MQAQQDKFRAKLGYNRVQSTYSREYVLSMIQLNVFVVFIVDRVTRDTHIYFLAERLATRLDILTYLNVNSV